MSEEIVREAFAGRGRPLLSYGIPFPDAAVRHVTSTFNASRVYVICSKSLAHNTDAFDRLTAVLGPKVVGCRVGMQSHTLWSEVLEIVEHAQDVQADLILTLGAGSITDGAKIVAVALANQVATAKQLKALAEGPNKRAEIKAPSVPIISVPTSLSAGEYSDFAGATEDDSRHKYAFRTSLRGPGVVILDPDLAASTPDSVWFSTGIRAVDHCVETLCAVTGMTPASDALARKALSLLIPGLLRCKRNHADRYAYLQCQLGSVDAMAACTDGSVNLGASHGIGHQLGPLGVGHGQTSCILLPAVCKYNAAHNANCDRQARVCQFLVQDPFLAELFYASGIDTASLDLGDILKFIIRELDMPQSLADVGVSHDQIDGLAASSLHDRWCKTNPVPLIEKAQVLEILTSVL